MLKSIGEIQDPIEQELELNQFYFEKVFRTLAFFLNVEVDGIRESEFVGTLVGYYTACIEPLFEQENEEMQDLKQEFMWNEEKWVLASPQIKHGDKMKFGEFIDSKQIIQDMVGMGKNRWECLVPLAAIFLRKDGEPYEEQFLYEGSSRLALMRELPLDIALNVGFFLSSSVTTYSTAFQSSQTAESRKTTSMLKPI